MTTIIKRILPLSLLLLFFFSGFAQKNIHRVKTYNQFKAIRFDTNIQKTDNFFSSNAEQMGLSSDDEMRLIQTRLGLTQFKHYRYQQFHKNLPVFGASYTLHEKDGFLVSANGFYLPHIDLNTTPQLNELEIKRLCLKEFADKNELIPKARCCSKETHEHNYDDEDFSDIKILSMELTIVDKHFPTHSNEYALAYKIELQSGPLDKALYFIDAHKGSFITALPLIMHDAVPAIAKTKYYGEREIITDSIAPNQFVLRDPTRGNDGISTYNDDFQEFFDNDNYWDLENEDMDEVALDVHFCTEQFYDLVRDDFAWEGVDGFGLSMNAVVHVLGGVNYVNAYWDGEFAYFGNGDCHRGPLTTLEVVGHEFAHGITQNSSGLVYRNESGAINESMSDIFGKALEYEVDPDNFNWYIGASFLYNDKTEPFRNMQDPNSVGNPGFYKGNLWRDGAGVHTNSGVGNKWFQTLVDGDVGINENGENYNCNGLGMKSASKIAFVTNTVYLTESSDYNAFYRSSVLAAEELYGTGSTEVDNVIQAWKAVGLPYGDLIGDLDLALEPVNDDFIISTCIDNQFYSIEFYVINTSSTDYEASMGAWIDMPVQNGNDLEYQLDQNIAAGDTLVVVIDDMLLFDETDDYVINLELIFTDYNANNNKDRIYVSNALAAIPDLTISAVSQSTECFFADSQVSVRLENEGCFVEEDTEIFMWIESSTGEMVWERTLILNSAFGQNNTRFYTATFEPSSSGTSDYSVHVEVNVDADLSNNSEEFQVAFNEPITEEFLNTFSETTDLGGQTRLYDALGIFGEESLYDFNGESFFASTGAYSFLFTPMCTGGPEEIFTQNENNLHSFIELCTDLKDMDSPVLSFDLVQFQNEQIEYYDEVSEWTTMISVSWFGTHEGLEYFTAQPEGVVQNHKIPLPENFVGSIMIDFFNATGTGTSSFDFLEYDVNLLDNLKISSDPGVATKDLEDINLNVFPNPSSDVFYLMHDREPIKMTVVNAQGERVQEIKNQFGKVDLNSYPQGYYLLSVQYPDGKFITKKLIKIDQ